MSLAFVIVDVFTDTQPSIVISRQPRQINRDRAFPHAAQPSTAPSMLSCRELQSGR